MGSALIVHDNEATLAELRDVVGTVVQADCARTIDEASRRIKSTDYSLLVLEYRPPASDSSVKTLLSEASHALAVVLIERQDDASTLESLAPGRVFRFVTGDRERWQLSGTIREAMRLADLRREHLELVRKLGGEHSRLQKREKLLDVVVRERTKELETAYLRLKAANRQALLGLAEAIEAKDAYTKGHCGRVAEFTMALAAACTYPAAEMETLEYASFLHDIGKIGVRDAVLLKPGPLDSDEWIHMKTHPVTGDTIASQIDMLKPMRPVIRNHHERWDGKGYPDALVSINIPLAARIVCITDAFDAMITDRPYKKAFPYEECVQLLRKGAAAQFDPDLVEIFAKNRIGADLG